MKRIYGRSPLERLLAHSEKKPNGCLEYLGNRSSDGYCRFKVDHVNVAIHRYAYENQVGPIPDGYTIDHLCKNRACINIEHMEPVPLVVNIKRGDGVGVRNSRKDTCHKGHTYSPDSMHVERGKYRRCVICRRERERNYRRWESKRTASGVLA